MILELTGFILAFSYRSKLEKVYKDSLSEVLGIALDKNNTKVLNIFHDLEKSMDCCGANGATDYYDHHQIAPPQCAVHPKGCSTAIIDWLDKNLPIIGGVLGAVLVLEVIGLLSVVVLAVALKHAPDDSYSSSPAEVLSHIVPGRRRNYSRV